ncbi:hypothetical protein K1T71_014199 [Dendrolimus kikuchii]|uniref:Uncharacterized protein n=1 Tax=Dendrolimus kikuchii TaxID=765133 RepID=A0ACC1CFL5_9NEOP|nr:hypothetical protein K1T71_014199 [Dendrolimus kikuchii]
MVTRFISIFLLLFLIQMTSSQCLQNAINRNNYDSRRATKPFDANYNLAVGSNIGQYDGLPVISVSPIAPTGLSVCSKDLVFEGPVMVSGEIPFLGTVGVKGVIDKMLQRVINTNLCTCGCL